MYNVCTLYITSQLDPQFPNSSSLSLSRWRAGVRNLTTCMGSYVFDTPLSWGVMEFPYSVAFLCPYTVPQI